MPYHPRGRRDMAHEPQPTIYQPEEMRFPHLVGRYRADVRFRPRVVGVEDV